MHSYVSSEEKAELMNRARFIITRSGYTTMMELAELDKKHGLFTPTPGQTEQEYLSRYYARQGWFLSRSQYKLKLPEDVQEAMQLPGISGDGQDPGERKEALSGCIQATSELTLWHDKGHFIPVSNHRRGHTYPFTSIVVAKNILLVSQKIDFL